jgi:hypothetical protein
MPGKHAQSLIIATLTVMLAALSASAAPEDGAGSRVEIEARNLPATFPVYVVPYMAADESIGTVISIANLGDTPCLTVVDWKIGHGTFTCTTALNLAGGAPVGDVQDHCVRRTTGLPVGCNAWCADNIRIEGGAIVRAQQSCRGKIAVDARLYYFNGGVVAGVADLKVIKLPNGSKGE